MKNKITDELNEIIDGIDNIWKLIGLLIIILLCVVLGHVVLGLICWGVINGILFLFGMPTTFTYLQGFILGFVIRGVEILITPLRVKVKKEEWK